MNKVKKGLTVLLASSLLVVPFSSMTHAEEQYKVYVDGKEYNKTYLTYVTPEKTYNIKNVYSWYKTYIKYYPNKPLPIPIEIKEGTQPEPEPAPQPEPAPVPEPEPAPAPQPEPAPAPQPEPAPVPEPEPAPQPEPVPEPAPVPQPIPQPQPEPAPVPQEPETEHIKRVFMKCWSSLTQRGQR